MYVTAVCIYDAFFFLKCSFSSFLGSSFSPAPFMLMTGVSTRQLAQTLVLAEMDLHSSRGEILVASVPQAPEGCLLFDCYSEALACLNSIDRSIWKGTLEGAASVFKIFIVRSLGLVAASSGSCCRIGLVRVGTHQYTIGFKPLKEFSLFLLTSLSEAQHMSWASMGARRILKWSRCEFRAGDFDWLAFVNLYVQQLKSSSQLQLFTFGKKGNMWEL